MANKLKVGITIGDINGIGPEIIVKTFSDDRIYRHFTPVCYGSSKALTFYKNKLKADNFKYTQIKSFERLSLKSLNMINVHEDSIEPTPGQSTPEAGKMALDSLDMAIKDLKANNIDILVTAPINKSNIPSKDDQKFTGQTEYIGSLFDNPSPLMVLYNDMLKVALVTTHLPLKDVAANISEEKVYQKIKAFEQTLREDFMIEKPKIAVLGLNPHAGDSGLIGSEEEEIIVPAVKRSKKDGFMVLGPIAADGFFASGSMTKFDGVLAMYHDQGLIPLKMVGIGSGVNFTAGLKVIRTSPDHGTAYDIAGKNAADESSFRNAIFEGVDMWTRRHEHVQMHDNPMQKNALADEN